MSRVTKWKIEKTKVKVVFRLQFHATHIPQSGWDKLFISFIPADSGKATSKTTKANVRNGTCKWADPIYETTRLLQDIKTRQYEEKFYKLLVGMGSSRSSILGEANINLADFVDALKPTAVSLPLNGSETGVMLHVTVQLLTSKTGFREFEQQRELREKGLQNTSDQGTHDESADSKESSPDQNVNNHINKVNSRVKLKRESKDLPRISSLEGESGVNEEYADSAAGFDGSSSTSGSIYTEKHDISSTHEVDSLKSAVSGDLGGLSLGQSPQPEKGEAPDNQFPSQGSDWVHGWSVDYSAASEDSSSSKLKGNLAAIESSILDLKVKVSSLQNHADEIGVETLKFSGQLATEISSGEELAKEVTVLKSECSKFRDEFEQLKSSKLRLAFTLKEPIDTDRDKLFQNLQHKWIKGLLLMEDKLRDIQKVSMGFPDRDFRFLNLELEALAVILQNLKQESGEPISGAKAVNERENKKKDLHKSEQFLTDIGSDAGLFQPENMNHYLSIPGLVSNEFGSVDPTLAMKEKIFELLRELDESKTERESLVRKMDQMECYYEALIQELEQNQRQMMAELQNLRNEHSTCLYTISAGKTEMERMHQNMNEQIMKFSEDNRILESLNSEFERRATSAEAALKRARLNYSIAVGQLQKDLELLSCQVLSMHETNENLIKQTLSDSSYPNTDGSPEPVTYPKNSEGHTSSRLLSQNHSSSLQRQHLGEDILLSDLKRSLQLQEGLYRQVEEEISQMHFVNIYSDVFSKALQETLLEASLDIQLMKEKIVQLSQQLELTNESNELLVLRLQNAMNDIVSLNEYKEICTAKSNDIALQNQILEANLKDLVHENNVLTKKINELEVLLTECRSFEDKYMACSTENSELKSLLKKESLESNHLLGEISILQEELKSLGTKFDEQVSMKDNLQNNVIFFSNKLQKLLASYEERQGELSLCSRSACMDSECEDLEGLLLRLEELQQSAFHRILLLIEEKEILVHEKHMAHVSLNTAESDVLVMKQKFEHDLQEMLHKISMSGTLLQKLQLDFEVIIDRINAGFEAEELYSQHHKEFLSGLDHLEAELQQLNSRNQDLAQEIIKLDTSSSDLEMCKLTLLTIIEEKKDLESSLQEKTEESAKISSKLNSLEKSLHSLHNELHAEKTVREKLEKTVSDLTTDLNEKQIQLQGKKDLELSLQEKIEESAKISSEFNSLEKNLHSLHNELHAEKTVREKLEKTVSDLSTELNVRQIQLQEKRDLESSLQEKTEESAMISSELNSLEKNLLSLHNELHSEKTVREKLEKTVSDLTTELNAKQIQLQEKKDLELSLQEKREESVRISSELNSLEKNLHSLHNELHAEKTAREELEKTISDLTTELNEKKMQLQEKKDLALSLQEKAEESAKISSEFNSLEKNLHSLHNELHAEKTVREKLEKTISDLTVELNEKQCQLQDSDLNRQELIHLKQMVTDLEFEKSRISDLQLKSEEHLKDALKQYSSISCLETQLSEMHEFSAATDVAMTYTRAQFEDHMEELAEKLHSTCRQLDVLHKKNLDVESELDGCLCRELTCIKENTRLLTSLDFLKSELEVLTAQNRALIDQNSAMMSELKEHESRTEKVNDTSYTHERQCILEVERMEQLLASCCRDAEELFLSKEEAELKCIVLQDKLDELETAFTSLKQSDDELIRLQNQCNELTRRLAEQVLKTEEFKNLSIHFKELKDKAEAESLNAHDRRGHEGAPVAMQESLRIAFIKEQYESKLQELRQQLSLSKKHSEEMLWKLQDAIDETENRKKSEASQIKINEELGMKILELEAELQAVISDKRNLLNAYDLIKAEKECSAISLECCKQEKQELEASLVKCNEEKSKIEVELTLAKELVETSKSHVTALNEGNGVFSSSLNPQEKSTREACSHEPESASLLVNMQPKDPLAPSVMNGCQTLGTEKDLHQEEVMKHVASTESLKSIIDHLNKELERMKNENMLSSVDDHSHESSFPGLQRELMQLHEANQELGNIFPVFDKFSVSGNALERVLALEIELAEALRTKKSSSFQFQSSFLKQHSDEEAVFRSFRDINELIKDMLELKTRHSAVETELKEMHDRYSQLSLQFAEVEGERQKLMMTIKNTRASKKASN
ncbi:centrosome-associated protein CEP250 [Cajanus cajan]|uniref:centrosome-associated protein CEP250 n=1 Tax=Cajanus cajan TaxID=3821 RepID=UPI00098D7A42|nr:centrosome-associated protein CEP250 [Cajanus cajan]XP_020212083.1 centrosome-associated protein CEP250 [Cajanus cajan]XP_020212084.1 centrosome-associated protein CEP250 [Cajanus cajan]